MVHPAVSRALFDPQALQTTTQTNRQPCQMLARAHDNYTPTWMDGWLGSLKKKEETRGGPVRHTKPLPPKADGQTRRGKTTDPPDGSFTQRAHHEAPSSFLATSIGERPHGFLLVSPASR